MWTLDDSTGLKPGIRRGKILAARDCHSAKPGFVSIVTVGTISSQRVLGCGSGIAGYLL